MTKEECKNTAIRTIEGLIGDGYAVKDDQTIDIGWAYLFFWDSKQYLETGDVEQASYGNVPLLVDKNGGTTEFVHHVDAADFSFSTRVKEISKQRNQALSKEVVEYLDTL